MLIGGSHSIRITQRSRVDGISTAAASCGIPGGSEMSYYYENRTHHNNYLYYLEVHTSNNRCV